MKTVRLFLTILIIAAAVGGCEYNFTEDIDMSAITQGKLKKIFNGGNVECDQLSMVDANFQNLSQTTGRNNYDAATNKFENGWPTGLEVEVMADGSVSWALSSGYISIDGTCYKVGAAIVKGSDASNIFYYGTEGVTGDMNLFPPINSSGQPSELSNLTFCFVEVECEKQPEFVIALKTYLTTSDVNDWANYATSGGEGVDNNLYIGYNPYIFNSQNIYPLLYGYNHDQIGTITASDYWENNIHYLKVVIDTENDDWLFATSLLYVGTLEGFNNYLVLASNGKYDVNYQNFPFRQDEIQGVRTFIIPFNEITE